MMTGFRLNLSPLKEPLGFVKLVEWVSSMHVCVCVCQTQRAGRFGPLFFFFFPEIFTLEKKKSPKVICFLIVICLKKLVLYCLSSTALKLNKMCAYLVNKGPDVNVQCFSPNQYDNNLVFLENLFTNLNVVASDLLRLTD